MKVIDLLNKIANDEEVPNKIKYHNYIFNLNNEDGICDYVNDDFDDNTCFLFRYLEQRGGIETGLNDEIEIIEEPKYIEKINRVERKPRNINNVYLKDKLNEIIDYINKGD